MPGIFTINPMTVSALIVCFKIHVYCVYCVVLYAFLMHIYQPLSTFAGADPESFEKGGGRSNTYNIVGLV